MNSQSYKNVGIFFTLSLISPNANLILNERSGIYFSWNGFCSWCISEIQTSESPLIFNTLPVNVLIVNIAAAFILGVFVVVSQQWHLDSKYSLFAAVGFCGSLTTMSAFALDSSNLLESN